MTNIQAIDLLKGLEKNLDDYCELNDEGKTVFRMAIAALEVFGNSEQLPSVQPYAPDTNVGDMISRQEAIHIVDGIDTWQAGWRGNAIENMKALPSAQPEIIHCKDCKFWTHIKRTNRYWCKTDDGLYDLNPSPNDFCSRAERRTDGEIIPE